VTRSLLVALCITLLGGCERKPRAREREAAEQHAKALARAKEAARRASLPPPEEPPVELLRVPNSGLPCQVDEVFSRKCRRCHTIPTRHGAPLVFLTWDDTQQQRGGQKLSEVIGRAVRSNFMPYRIEANPPVQPLTDDEKRIILDWVEAGAPREDCDPNATAPKKSTTKVIKAGGVPPRSSATAAAASKPVR
jgi:hypothetical protein